VINFLALLGWNPGTEQEIFSLDELVRAFSFDRCSKSGAKFDFEKAKWFNHKYIHATRDEELAAMFMPILKEKGIEAKPEYVCKVVALVKDRVNFVKELWEQSSYFFVAPEHYDEKTVKKRWKAETPDQMRELIRLIENMEDFSAENQERIIMKWIEDNRYHTGNVMNAFRLALVGEGKGPHIFDITVLLGKEETLRRLRKAIERISVPE
jgi:glutamyl-tRNA synthetase